MATITARGLRQINFHPANCPVCGSPAGGTILTCNKCWWKVPAKDRMSFGKLYRQSPQAAQSKGASILSRLKEPTS